MVSLGRNRKFQGFVGSTFLSDNAVTSPKIADSAVITDKIAADQVDNSKLTMHQVKCVRYTYDFSIDGGSSIPPFLPLQPSGIEAPMLPACVIKNVWLRIDTAPTSSGSATISLGTQPTPTAFIGATAFNNSAFALNAATELLTNPLNVLSDTQLVINIGTADLTAGKMTLWVEYLE